jgi:hypothetical protein
MFDFASKTLTELLHLLSFYLNTGTSAFYRVVVIIEKDPPPPTPSTLSSSKNDIAQSCSGGMILNSILDL